MKSLYLDSNAHMPMHPKALQAFIEFNSSPTAHGHPLSPSVLGRQSAAVIEEARTKIAGLIGAKSSNQIFFTSTCTQACEWAIFILNKISGNKPVYISPAEHPAIKQAAKETFKDDLIELDIDGYGVVGFSQGKFGSFLDSSVICIHVQNEIGVIEPIDKINAKYILSDMSQTPGKIKFNLSSMNVDIATFSAHKFMGPASVGFIYLRDPSWWKEFDTGSRYFMDRAGTPDTANIVATAVALDEAVQSLPERTERMVDFRNTLETGLKELGLEIVGENVERVPGTTFVSLPGSAMSVLLSLGERNIHVGLGSACGSIYTGPSPLMKKIGKEGGSGDYLRISHFGEYTSKEAQLFLDKFKECIV